MFNKKTQINNTKTHITNNNTINIFDDSSIMLSNNSAFELNIINENNTFRSLTRYENHDNKLICSKNLVEWYDPIEKKRFRKSNSIDYIIDYDEL